MLFADNRLSCSLFARCPLPAVPGTFYCNLHLRAMVDLAVRFNLDPVTKAANRQVHRSQPAYDLDLNAASEADIGQLRVLSDMYENPQENWIVETEFLVVKGLLPVIWSISIAVLMAGLCSTLRSSIPISRSQTLGSRSDVT